MTVHRRVLQRLLAEIDRFDAGQLSPQDLQGAILAHGRAVDLGQHWHDLIDRVEGAIEIARFTSPSVGLPNEIRPHLDQLRAAIGRAMEAERSDSDS